MRLQTPRDVLNEVRRGANKPWWATRLANRMEAHLTRSMFRGRPIIDTPMSEAACEAVLEEARKMVREPDPADPVGEMLYDMAPKGTS